MTSGEMGKSYRWERPLAGLLAGAVLWYAAHEIGFYFSDYNCKHRWILPTVHLLAFAVTLLAGILSYREFSRHRGDGRLSLVAGLGTASAALFAFVILWQGIATIIFSGCER